MIAEIRRIKRVCANYWKIKNYDKAIADENETWVLHHRDEVKKTPSGIIAIRSKQELIENGRYYDCPPNELIFIKKKYHSMIHSTFPTEETIRKISLSCSKSLKGRKFSKEHMTDEIKQHLSDLAKNRDRERDAKGRFV